MRKYSITVNKTVMDRYDIDLTDEDLKIIETFNGDDDLIYNYIMENHFWDKNLEPSYGTDSIDSIDLTGGKDEEA